TAAELDNHCPICLDSWVEASYALPCLHQFCYTCILQWAKCKPECPLCKRRVTSILHLVRGDDDFQEHVIPPPAAPARTISLVHQNHILDPAASQPSAAGRVPRAPLGGLHPHIWALLFREDPALLRPVLLWLQQELRLIFAGAREAAEAARRLILSSLQLFGLDRETLIQLLLAALGQHTRGFAHRLIVTITDRSGGEARRWMGLEDADAAEEWAGSPVAAPGPAASRGGSPAPSPAPSSSSGRSEAEELASASSAALGGGAGSPSSASIPTHQEQEEPQEDPEEAVAGPSTPGQDGRRYPGRPHRAPKRRAGSPEDPSQSPKKPPRCH
ncbi:TOPRS ligase, partial [Nyctibius bracteatus]|nr:TOPRS ligase [Nyctibius bracteatus]